MAAGSVAGAIGFKVIPAQSFDFLVGVVVAVLGFWFLFGRNRKADSSLKTALPKNCTVADLAVSVFSGICGGLFGVSGPPIVFWLGRTFTKITFRRTLISVFLFAAVARLATYGATGLLYVRFITLILYVIPGIILGVLLGNRIFHLLSETWFSRVVGGVLLIASVKLLLRG